MDFISVLNKLSSAVGVSGAEESVSAIISQMLKDYTDDVTCDSLGNVIGKIKTQNPKWHVLLDAHLDEIGLIVTHIDEQGFIKVGAVGGVDKRLLLAQQVTICGKKSIKGVVCSKPPHLESGKDAETVPDIDSISIDTGFTKAQLEDKISLGDRVYINSEFSELLDGKVSGKALDNRAGVTAILYALEKLKSAKLQGDVTVLFSTQEEVGTRGARVAGFKVMPDEAISVDVSFAYTQGCPETKCGQMGKGAMIGVAPTLTKSISEKFIEIAKQNSIPHQLEIMSGQSGTNADMLGVTASGVKTGLLSIPLKYMHTPVEVVKISDIQSVGDLIAAYLIDKEA